MLSVPKMRDAAWNKQIGERLALTREALGYPTQSAFVDAIQGIFPVSQQRWNAYERGRERITVPVALALCVRFDITLDWIYRGRRGDLPLRLAERITEVEKKQGSTVTVACLSCP